MSAKEAGMPTPVAVAETVKEPAMVLAVKRGAVATPLPPVLTVALLAKEPDAPLPGMAKMTERPGTGLSYMSRTVARRVVAKGAPMVALWLLPVLAMIVAALPAVFPSAKTACSPDALARTA